MLKRLTVLVGSSLVCMLLIAVCTQVDEPPTGLNDDDSAGPKPTMSTDDRSAETEEPLGEDRSCLLADPDRASAPPRMTISYARLELILASGEASAEQVTQVQKITSAYSHAIEAGSLQDVQTVSSSRWWNELGLEGCADYIESVDGEPEPDAFTLEITGSYAFEDGVAAYLQRSFVESDEMTVFFVVLKPDDSGELKIDYFLQSADFNDMRSADGLGVDDGFMYSVRWAEIQEHGLPELPDDVTVVGDHGPCGSSMLLNRNSASRPHHVVRSRPAYWTSSYALLKSVVESKDVGTFASPINETFTEPGELRVFFAFKTPEASGRHEVIDYFTRRSPEGLFVDEYEVVSVRWTTIREHGLPADIPVDAASVTFACSSKRSDR